MKRMFLAAVAAALIASLAQAQPHEGGRRGGRASATLYELPDFQGREITVSGAVSNLPANFNDTAMSARFTGRWRVCEHSDFRGDCQDVSGDVANLTSRGLAQRISSLQAYVTGDWGGAGRPGGRGGDRPIDGARNVLFPYPSFSGYDVAAGSAAANAFCRAMDLGPASYFDGGERAAEAVDGEGRLTGGTAVLRDVLCRRY
ncbi:MAG: beta/gamma crystallin-related protein [Phenylobacterium sp.]